MEQEQTPSEQHPDLQTFLLSSQGNRKEGLFLPSSRHTVQTAKNETKQTQTFSTSLTSEAAEHVIQPVSFSSLLYLVYFCNISDMKH